jgi:hypothetical protein
MIRKVRARGSAQPKAGAPHARTGSSRCFFFFFPPCILLRLDQGIFLTLANEVLALRPVYDDAVEKGRSDIACGIAKVGELNDAASP